MADALAGGRLDPCVPTAVARFVALLHNSDQGQTPVNAAERGELSVFDDITAEVQQYGCSEKTKPYALALLKDDPLLDAFDELVTVLFASPSIILHGGLAAPEAVRVAAVAADAERAIAGNTQPSFTISPSPGVCIGSAAVDIGGLLASILLVAIERSHAADAPPPPVPTWPPAPLSSRSPAHAAAHALWHAYLAARADAGGVDETSLLQLTVGYAGCEVLRQTLRGAAAFAQLGGEARGHAERCAIGVGRELVLHSAIKKLVHFDGVFTILESNTNSNKHAQPAAFAVFSDFSD